MILSGTEAPLANRFPWTRDPRFLVPALLAALALGLLLLEPARFASPPYPDAWIYFDYFLDAPGQIASHPDAYYSSRLSVIIPSYLSHRLLPATAAHFALHLALYAIAVLAFWAVVRRHFGEAVGVLAALLLGSHPLFVSTLGWNYVDGFGITYFLAALACASAAPWARRPALTAAATGVALTALASANLYYALLAPFVLAELALQRHRAGGSLLRDLGWAGVGALGTLLAVGSVSAAWGGHFFYLEPSLVFARGYLHLEENPWVKQGLSWLRWAHWLIVPLAVAIGSLVTLVRLRRTPASVERTSIGFAQLQFLGFAAALQLSAVVTGGAPLQKSYYASLLLAPAFFALAGQLARLVPERRRLPRPGVLAAVFVLSMAPYLVGDRWLVANAARLLPWSGLLAVAAVLAVAFVPRRTFAVVAVFALLVPVSCDLRPLGTVPQQISIHRQLAEAVRLIEEHGAEEARLWFAQDGPVGLRFDAIAAAFLFAHLVNNHLPELDGGRTLDGGELRPGESLLLMSDGEATLGVARSALANLGFKSSLKWQERVPGNPPIQLTLLTLQAPPLSSTFVDFRDGRPHPEAVAGFYPLEAGYRWLGRDGQVRLTGAGPELQIVAATAVPELRRGLGVGEIGVRLSLLSGSDETPLSIGRIVVASSVPQLFRLEVPRDLPARRPIGLRLEAERTWCPADVIPGSRDTRRLSVMIFAIGFPESQE